MFDLAFLNYFQRCITFGFKSKIIRFIICFLRIYKQFLISSKVSFWFLLIDTDDMFIIKLIRDIIKKRSKFVDTDY